MTMLTKFRMVGITTLLGLALILGVVSSVYAAPAANGNEQTAPKMDFTSGQANADPKLRGDEAKVTEPKGPTNLVKTAPQSAVMPNGEFTAQVGAVASVDFTGVYNYCYRDQITVQFKNNTTATKYVQIRIYNQSGWQEKYVTVNASAYGTATFYGVQGTYGAYMYVWNGTTYQYDEYRSSENTCRVSITRTYNYNGLVQLKYQNTGTAFASVRSTQLAPYAGNFYNSLTAGSAAQYRTFSVGTNPYGIVADVTGSSQTPSYFYGDL